MDRLKRRAPAMEQNQEYYEVMGKKIKKEDLLPLKKHLTPKRFPIYNKIQSKMQVNLSELNLGDSGMFNISILASMDHRYLRTLNLNKNYLISLKGLEKCNFLSLEIMYLRFNKLNDDIPFHLYQLPKIIRIYLNQNRITHLKTNKLRLTCPQLASVQMSNNVLKIDGNPVIRQKWKYQYLTT